MFDYAIHSDLLVYWTGRDIDEQYDAKWYERKGSYTDPEWTVKRENEYSKSKDDPEELTCEDEQELRARVELLEKRYLQRLHSILEHGLWMTTPSDIHKQPDSELTLYMSKSSNVSLPPDVARVCFTELRLSEARAHAAHYGRLGIGVKRPFLFDRGGRPVAYCGPKVNRERDPFLCACDSLFKGADRALLHFFKPMHSGKGRGDDLYAESEWRIVYYGDLLDPANRRAGYPDKSHGGRCSACVRANPQEQAFLDSLCEQDRKVAEQRLRFLLPLDGWLSCIIYPSMSLKRQALEDEGIRQEIKRIKSAPECRANDVEKGNWPVEMDLDLCRNL